MTTIIIGALLFTFTGVLLILVIVGAVRACGKNLDVKKKSAKIRTVRDLEISDFQNIEEYFDFIEKIYEADFDARLNRHSRSSKRASSTAYRNTYKVESMNKQRLYDDRRKRNETSLDSTDSFSTDFLYYHLLTRNLNDCDSESYMDCKHNEPDSNDNSSHSNSYSSYESDYNSYNSDLSSYSSGDSGSYSNSDSGSFSSDSGSFDCSF